MAAFQGYAGERTGSRSLAADAHMRVSQSRRVKALSALYMHHVGQGDGEREHASKRIALSLHLMFALLDTSLFLLHR